MATKQVEEEREVPIPKRLTSEDLAEADREASEWRKSVEHGTRTLEEATP